MVSPLSGSSSPSSSSSSASTTKASASPAIGQTTPAFDRHAELSGDTLAHESMGTEAPNDNNEHSPLLSPVDAGRDGFARPRGTMTARRRPRGLRVSDRMVGGALQRLALPAFAWLEQVPDGSRLDRWSPDGYPSPALHWNVERQLSHSLGKRKPFMVGGAVATAVSLVFLSWTREIVGGFLGLFGADPESDGVKVSIIVVAVAWVYILDVAINTVQAAIRAFIVDCAPTHQQEAANSMASRIVGFGNILGYCAGYIDLPRYVGWLGDTQFKVLCAIASIALCLTIIVSVVLVHERDPNLDGPAPKGQAGIMAFFRTIFTSIKRLPPQIRKVCTVQFCAWVGFFPMLFYTSSYIGEIYIEPFLEANPHMTPKELDRLYEEATRVGTFALLIFAICSLATNVLLPFFIAPTYDSAAVGNAPAEVPGVIVHSESPKKTWLDYLVIPGFTLRRAWMLSHILFSGAMFCTVLVRSVEAATALIGLVGITWALTLWAPWAIISAEISRRDAVARLRKQHMETLGRGDASAPAANTILEGEHSLQNDEDTDKAGVILATIGSSIIFKVFQKPRGTPGDHSIAVVLALGGIFTLIAAWFVHLIKDEMAPVESLVTAEEGEGLLDPENGKKSMDEPRTSMQRAGIARSTSFGAGLEY
ncbi:major facilitator superfamily domain-containing protein [Apiospora kogelbergensis]|uniref:major facilitator superfamily domain-containing protein n=1 Tax=Apiospora kogelbergensis TaxID=1337665 RepID=UPI00312E6E2D